MFVNPFFLKFQEITPTAAEEALVETPSPSALLVGNPFLKKVKVIVSVENTNIYTATSVSEAVAIVFALYFIINCEYPKKIKNTLQFLQHYIVNARVANDKPSPTVINFVEKFASFKAKTQ